MLFSFHNDKQKREWKGTLLHDHYVRVNDSLDALRNEQKLLSLNLSSVGGILNEFIYELFVAMEWKDEVDRVVRTTPDSIKEMRRMDGRKIGLGEASDETFERIIMATLFAQRLLGVLDFVDDAVNTTTAARAAACIESFFTQKMVTNEYMYFIPAK